MRLRCAVRADLAAVLALIREVPRADGEVEVEVDPASARAFADIEADPRNELLVLDDGGEIVGCLQATYVPGLGRGGAERALLEAVRIREDRRGKGLGHDLLRAAIDRARDRGCTLVQLTSDKRRTDAHRFYGSLGFVGSHDGFKLDLSHRTRPST
jgi:GNAT superfamily N-acetyltransferase